MVCVDTELGEADQPGLVRGGPLRVFSGAKEVVLSSDVDLHSLCDGSQIRFSLTADEEMDSLQGQGYWDGQLGELDVRVLATFCFSADRCFRNWEDVVLDPFACNYEDHPVTRRRRSDITAVEPAALHHELAARLTHLRWSADFAMEEHWHSSDAVYQHFQRLIRIWYTDGTCDHLNFGGVAAMEELARRIRIYVDVLSDSGNVIWSD